MGLLLSATSLSLFKYSNYPMRYGQILTQVQCTVLTELLTRSMDYYYLSFGSGSPRLLRLVGQNKRIFWRIFNSFVGRVSTTTGKEIVTTTPLNHVGVLLRTVAFYGTVRSFPIRRIVQRPPFLVFFWGEKSSTINRQIHTRSRSTSKLE